MVYNLKTGSPETLQLRRSKILPRGILLEFASKLSQLYIRFCRKSGYKLLRTNQKL